MFVHQQSHIRGSVSLLDHSGNQPLIYNIIPTGKLITSCNVECGVCVKDMSQQNKVIAPQFLPTPVTESASKVPLGPTRISQHRGYTAVTGRSSGCEPPRPQAGGPDCAPDSRAQKGVRCLRS